MKRVQDAWRSRAVPARWMLVVGLTATWACGSNGSPPGTPEGTGGQNGASTGGHAGSGGLLTSDGSGGQANSGGTGAGGAPAETGSGGQGDNTGGVVGADTVSRTTSTYSFEHFPIETNDDDVWNGPAVPATPTTTTTFETLILENAFLKVTLLPSYGGRILSIVHKPTARELLYQNPIGTPYLMGEDIFYYNYLVILGGIFPSFPEPEHGRYWNQPYQLEIISESAQAITVRMSRRDDIDVVAGVPQSYDVGRTDILVELDVTLRAGRSNLELETRLTNTRSSAVDAFEYWTVTTLAPGSTPGDTKIPLQTSIWADMDQVHCLESSWAWFGDAETRVSGEIFQWKNLSQFQNWVDQGTAFANPEYQANWSGLFNSVNKTAVLRVSEDQHTPGLKLWTFGRDSLDVDVNDGEQWLRPTIEMWHGVTPEFWDRGTMAAGEVRSWRDHYFASLGLDGVTAASEHGAVYLQRVLTGAQTQLSATATLNLPGQTVRAVLRLDGVVLHDEQLIVESTEPNVVSALVPDEEAHPGAVVEAEFFLGEESLLVGQWTLD